VLAELHVVGRGLVVSGARNTVRTFHRVGVRWRKLTAKNDYFCKVVRNISLSTFLTEVNNVRASVHQPRHYQDFYASILLHHFHRKTTRLQTYQVHIHLFLIHIRPAYAKSRRRSPLPVAEIVDSSAVRLTRPSSRHPSSRPQPGRCSQSFLRAKIQFGEER